MKRLLALTLATLMASALSAPAAADVASDWKKHCKSCHGAEGAGDTKLGKKFKVKNLQDPKVQKGFSDDDATKAIRDGMKNDKGKVVMKAMKDKLSPTEIAALVKHVRALAKK